MKLRNTLIIGLFSLLLIPSFSNALTLQNSNNNWELSPYDSNIQRVVSPYWWIASRRIWYNSKMMLYVADNDNWRAFMFRDINHRPYMYVWIGPWQYQSSYFYNEWEILDYQICDELISSSSVPENCVSYSVNSSSDEVFENFNTNTTLEDYYYINLTRGFDSSAARWTFTVCFSNHSLWKSICYNASTCVKHYNYWTCPSDWITLFSIYNFDWQPSFDTFPTSLLNFPPSAWGSSDVINPIESAQNIYDNYKRLWYSDVLCYWWFALDDVFSSQNSSLTWINIWSGVSIFDLYNSFPYDVYDWSELTFSQWYDSWDFEYWFFKDYHDSSEFEYYNWKSRGFVGAFLVKDYFFKWDNFDSSVLKSFCEFSFANDTLINKDSSPIDVVSSSLYESQLMKIIWDVWIILPSDWSALDYIYNLVNYNWYTWFNDVSDLWNAWYNLFNRFRLVHSWNSWILPNYIIVWFLAILFLYLLRK